MVRSSMIFTAALLGLFLTPAIASSIERFDLPGEVPLSTPRLDLELSNTHVEIHLTRDEESRISARPRELSETAALWLELDRSQPQTTRLSRPDMNVGTPWIIVEIFLSPDQVFSVIGSSIDLTVEGTENCPMDETSTDALAGSSQTPIAARSSPKTKREKLEEAPPMLSVDVSDSSVQVRCLPNLELTAERGTINIRDLDGPVALELTDAFVQVQEHHGKLTVHGHGSDLTIADSDGSVSIDVVGGSVNVTQSNVPITGKVSGSTVDLSDVTGSIRLAGNDSSIRISSSRETRIDISGSDNGVSVDGVTGHVHASLQGGSFDGNEIGARVDLQLSHDAEGDLRGIAGDVAATVTEGSFMRISDVTGHCRLQVVDGHLDVSQLKSLEIDADGSTIEGRDIPKLSKFVLNESNATLSLPELKGRPEIVISDDSFVDLEIPTPCSVEPISSGPFVLDQVEISGCQLVLPNMRQKQMAVGVDGKAPVHLRVRLDQSSRLEVDGKP